MLRNGIRFYISVLLSLVVAVAPLMADMNAAMLRASGNVFVNGSRVADSLAILDGDSVRTADHSAAALTLPGATLLLAPNSTLTYSDGIVQVICGSAVIRTSRAMRATTGQLTIAATERSAFEVQRTDSGLRIATLEGSVTVDDGVQAVALPVGSYLEGQGGCTEARLNLATTTPTTQVGAGSAGNQAFSNRAIAGIVIAAAIVTGLIIWAAVDDDDESPVEP